MNRQVKGCRSLLSTANTLAFSHLISDGGKVYNTHLNIQKQELEDNG